MPITYVCHGHDRSLLYFRRVFLAGERYYTLTGYKLH